jgi:CHAD domain-containing protein
MYGAESKRGRARAVAPSQVRRRARPAPETGATLTPRSTALAALGSIARAQLATFAASEAGMRRGEAAALHAGRVALRRLRTLLGEFEGVLAEPEGEELRAGVRRLAQRLGPARDLDVWLEGRPRGANEPSASVLAVFERERARRAIAVRRSLDSRRWARVRARLRSALAPRAAARSGGPLATRPFAAVLAKRLRRRLRRVRNRARRVRARARSAELHELRIACKKLRYLLECCRALVPRTPLERALARLKALQRELGTIQDTRVHAELVDELAPALRTAAGPDAARVLALFRHQNTRRARAARARFAPLPAAFVAPASRRDFERLLTGLEGTEKRR